MLAAKGEEVLDGMFTSASVGFEDAVDLVSGVEFVMSPALTGFVSDTAPTEEVGAVPPRRGEMTSSVADDFKLRAETVSEG